MKGKLPFLNAFMGLMILFAISFQSLHSFEHLAKEFSEKTCKHIYHKHQTEINHSHDDFENCFVCKFSFQHHSFLLKTEYNFVGKDFIAFANSEYQFSFNDYFCGKHFQLRAPPVFTF